MRCIITGVAGFIGSHLAERLITLGHKVVGIDCFTDYYPRKMKEDNIKNLSKDKNFTLIEADLLKIDLKKLSKDADVVFHEAAQAGVRASWGKDFEIYVNNNILATQKLLEAAKDVNLKKFIYASSSSVYGDANDLPVKETSLTKPISPYGVSKLAAEHLCQLYFKNYKVPTISLRYFTVYGPRQRPDMAFNQFIKAILNDEEIHVYGNGSQTRDFTYISDITQANIQAMESDSIGEIFNIGGGSNIILSEAIKILEEITGKKAKIKYEEKQKGDVRHTSADISKAEDILGYTPKIKIKKGLEKEYRWLNDKN